MMGWGIGDWGMEVGWIFMVLIWVLIILGIVALLVWLGLGGTGSREAPRWVLLEILQERYPRSEIEREEYEQKRRDLQG